MKDRPLMLSLLFGFIVVLVIVSVSFLMKMNSLSGSEKKLQLENVKLAEKISDLEKQNVSLNDEKKGLGEEFEKVKVKLNELNTEYTKLDKLKEKLEENLKDELMKQDIKEKK
ncbi:MAG: hypothetical protein Q8O30_04905 [Candidatus Omnitrophota bacterium]|nr:hypothetical protein [Candidatus Omnitrophota bacterium]